MEGTLIFNDTISRPDLVLQNGMLFGGLHCGDRIKLWRNGQWYAVRLEYQDGWIICSDEISTKPPYGEKVHYIA